MFDFSQLGFGITVALRDMFTQNAQRISASMQGMASQSAQLASQMQRNFNQVMVGAGMMGAGMAAIGLPTALALTTRDTQRALGELSSLGVQDLNALEQAATQFSNEWAGTSKAQFIAASYDIRSSISTLNDEAVAEFASLAALTGKATKATTEEMSGLFATGYGIYKTQFNQMTDMDFGRMFSGGIAKAVQSFKTTGPQMADAIKNIGALATAANVPMAEQLSILGQLQTTMPGAEAGTLYKNFVMKVGEAGKELGLRFVDAQGHMLGVVPIIQQLQQKFPDLASQAAQAQIKRAFGSDEAVKFVLQMAGNIGGLEHNISEMNAALSDGTALTMEMARAMNQDIGSRLEVLGQRWQNLMEVLGNQVLPVVTPAIDRIAGLVLAAQRLAETFPGVTRAILTASMAIGGLLVATGAVVAGVGAIGLFRLAWTYASLSIGSSAAAIGGAIAAAFWPLLVGIAASAMLRRAWDRDLGGIRTTLTRWYEQAALVFEGLHAIFSGLTGSTATMSGELAQRLQAAGLFTFTRQLAMGLYRVRQFVDGLVSGFTSGFETVAGIVLRVANIITLPLRPVIWLVRTLAEQLGWLVPLTASVRSEQFSSLGVAVGSVVGGMVALIGTWKAWLLLMEVKSAAIGLAAAARSSIGAWQWAAGAIAQTWQARLWSISQNAQTMAARLSTMNVSTIWAAGTAKLTTMKAAFLANVAAARTWMVTTLQSARATATALLSSARTAVISLGQLAAAYIKLGVQMAATTAGAIYQRGVWLAMNFGSVAISIGTVVSSYARMGVALAASTAKLVLQTGVWVAYHSTMIGVRALTLAWTAAQWLLNAALVANPVGAVVMGIALLAGAVVGIIRHWDAFKTKLWDVGAVLLDMPFLQPVYMAWEMAKTVWGLFTGQLNFAEAGANILRTIGNGILSTITWPFRLVWNAFGLIRQLLPFSDAKTGPLSSLTAAGASILRTIGNGILSLAGLPGKLLVGVFTSALANAGQVWSGLSSIVSTGFEAATSLVTSLGGAYLDTVRGTFQMAVDIAGSVWSGVTERVAAGWESAKSIVSGAWQTLSGMASDAYSFVFGAEASPITAPTGPTTAAVSTATPVPSPNAFTITTTNLVLADRAAQTNTSTPIGLGASEQHTELLASRPTRERTTHFDHTSQRSGGLEAQMSALLSRLGAMTDRPIELNVTVVSELDGRKIAEAVYRDMQQRRVRAYE